MCILAFAQRLTLPPSLLGNPDHLTAPVPEAQRRRIESDREAKKPSSSPENFKSKERSFPISIYFSISEACNYMKINA
jgi:hypothetical protein